VCVCVCVCVVYGSSAALVDASKTPTRSDLPETRTAQTGSLVHLLTGVCVCVWSHANPHTRLISIA